MPQVTLRTTVDGREESISEFICDWKDCPNVAVEVVAVIRELRAAARMCPEHATRFRQRHDASR